MFILHAKDQIRDQKLLCRYEKNKNSFKPDSVPVKTKTKTN